MAEEQVIKLLEEIRDLQKSHVENYKDALKNQQEAIALQKAAVRRQKMTALVLAVFLLGLLAFLIWSLSPLRGSSFNRSLHPVGIETGSAPAGTVIAELA